MSLPINPPFFPMEALLVDEIPAGSGWQYEPKWDGFRCLVFRDGARIELLSKAGKPLGRYFPELVAAIGHLRQTRFVVDGEIVIPLRGRLSFDDLLLRIHPSPSRIRKLSQQAPAALILFDMLLDKQRSLVNEPLKVRRQHLERFVAHFSRTRRDSAPIRLSPATRDRRRAERWFRAVGNGMDGIVAKRLEESYRPGERAMLKVKRMRTADCVVGGFRYATHGKIVGSLLLGLYDDEGLLDHVGFTSKRSARDRERLTPKVEALVKPPGFTGRAPGGPSRWSTKRSTEWQPLTPELEVEVQFDHFSGGRLPHGITFLRPGPDKSRRQCTFEPLAGSWRNMWKMLA